MATVTGLTAERMLEIEGESIVDAIIDSNGHLILTKFDGTLIDAGIVQGPAGPKGDPGEPGTPGVAGVSSIPGEIKAWPNTVLPDLADFGKWVWADGAVYAVATYPIAAGHIHANWKTAYGQSDPGVGNFRVPDLRGLVLAGLDQMPGGARANRMTRAVAITIVGKTGEETHVITVAEMAAHHHAAGSFSGSSHSHGSGTLAITPNPHSHTSSAIRIVSANNIQSGVGYGTASQGTDPTSLGIAGSTAAGGGGGISGTSADTGSNTAHENVQPTVFVPYIVRLDG